MSKASRKKQRSRAVVEAPKLLKLDLGCGKNKQPGFFGVDTREFDGVDLVCDLGKTPWVLRPFSGTSPWPSPKPRQLEDESVEAVHCSHFVEHLTAAQRIAFVNELHRVLIPGGKATIIVPHWASTRAYGDLTHQWPPVCEMWFNYLLKSWREKEAPHNDAYTCDFDITWGYTLRQDLVGRNEEFINNAIQNYKDAAADIVATFTKRS